MPSECKNHLQISFDVSEIDSSKATANKLVSITFRDAAFPIFSKCFLVSAHLFLSLEVRIPNGYSAGGVLSFKMWLIEEKITSGLKISPKIREIFN